jgi:hypothetical protein
LPAPAAVSSRKITTPLAARAVLNAEGRFWRDLVCFIGWHYWGRWGQPTAAADRYWQQRLCTRCGKAQVRTVG